MIFRKSSNQRISSHNDREIQYPTDLPPVVCVTWIDAETIGGPEWQDKKEAIKAAMEPLPVMITFGFLIYESKDQVVLSATMGPNEMAQVNKIPKRMILKLEEFKNGKP